MKLGKLEYHTAQSSSLWLLAVCPLKQEGTSPSVETALCFNLRRAFEASSRSSQIYVAGVGWLWLRCVGGMVINTVLSHQSVPNETPELRPRGHLCLCYSCPCLPSYTSGSFHWEKDAGSGATLQIPPGCGICNKQPRAMAAALSLLTPGTPPEVTSALFISSPNNPDIVSSLVPYKLCGIVS